MIVTLGELIASGLWEQYCDHHGFDPHAAAALRDHNEEVELTESDLRCLLGLDQKLDDSIVRHLP